jgi:GntR family transcriptional repressor for pyruvate dehydrogenase complex
MRFREFRRQVLSEEIVEELLSMIKAGEIRPGDRLPPERELASIMKVSRPSLREALRALSIMNVIEIRQGAGTHVTTLKPELLVERLDFAFSLEDSTFLQLFDARKIVEVGLAGLAAERIQDGEIVSLEAILAKSIDSVDDPDRFLEADVELHRRIADIARNPMLSRFMASLQQLSRASRGRTARLAGVIECAAQDHRAIVKAIVARDPEEARRAMRRHLEEMETRLKKAVPDPSEAERPFEI